MEIKDKINKFLSDKMYEGKTPLCDIMKNFGSDKGLGWHNYTTMYECLFNEMKLDKLNIFELGIGSNNIKIPSNMGKNGHPGASLLGWELYFPNSNIYGADIDKNILFETVRIKTFYCDQTDPKAIATMFNEIGPVEYDIIIEDGLHDAHANIIFFENSFKFLKSNGIYIVEDISLHTNNILKQYISTDIFKNGVNFAEIVDIPHKTNNCDNRLLIIQKK